MTTVFGAFVTTAGQWPDNAFFCAPPAPGRAYSPDGIEYTYAQTREQVLELRERYASAGYGPGHRVALLLENRPEFFFHYLALNGLGCGIVPINPDYRRDEMIYQMDHSGADLAVSLVARVADLEAVARERSKPLPVVDGGRLPARVPKPETAPRRESPGLDTECSFLYTSGTTGRPKGCILTNYYSLTSGAWYRDLGGLVQFENIIRRSGENIAAAEVEAVLQAHEAVAQVAVLAVPDEIREEEVMACVVPMPGVSGDAPLADRLLEWCLARLAYFKAPGFVLFMDHLPTTGTQKVQKTQIFPRGDDPRQRPGVIDLRSRKKR